ncbi:clotting factor G beta subunit-like [Daphnia pulex]|uniref:clotting factor G beta subunit-like n=1 Tax=Daphnia pulex TaxID=6669 RepID=UPI001EDFDF59|nr:clotting factor G beta subunit-like [Daphnia pulex]XP_046457803.1 clotting factor G beta subunit-like [Daphnia pulex]
MKALSLVCLLALAAMVSTAPQVPIPISNDNSKSKSIEEIKPIAPTVPVPGVTPAESKPKEWLSSTSTVADRSRCLKDYRNKNSDAPPPSAANITSPTHRYPFVVSIFHYSEDEGYHFHCSGSLISPTKILLIANFCLYYNPTYRITYPVENLKVRLGTQFLNETTSDAQVTKNVKEINLHDDLYFGLAILTMDSPVEYADTISPICLVPDCFDDDSGQSVIAMGWEYSPRPHEIDTKNSAFLGLVRLSTLPMKTCLTKDVDGNHNENLELCAQKECGDFCRNYRGGPVVIENNSRDNTSCRFMQVGVFDHFADDIDVGSFLRIKNYLPWIEKNSK